MTGRRTLERVSRPLSSLARAGVQLIEAEVTAVDPTAGRLSSSAGEIEYDQLVLAPGVRRYSLGVADRP